MSRAGSNDSRLPTRACDTSSKPLVFPPSNADNIFLSVFLAGMTIVFTLGAIKLSTIGLKQNFYTVVYSWVPAPANALRMALLELVITALAYGGLSRFKHTSLWRPELAYSVLSLLIGSISLLTYAHLSSAPAQVLMSSMLGCMVQIIAIAVFALVVIKTAHRTTSSAQLIRNI